jgi:tetratricopeptide (TPR) repeat protein
MLAVTLAIFLTAALGAFVFIVRPVISSAKLQQLSRPNSYKFLRLVIVTAAVVVSIFILTNLIVYIHNPYMNEPDWTAAYAKNTAGGRRISSMAYAQYKSSAEALLAFLSSHRRVVPVQIAGGVRADIRQGHTDNVASLVRFMRTQDRLGSDRAPVLYSCARYLGAQGAVELAQSAFEDAVRADPTDGTIAAEFALFLTDLGDPGRANEVLQAALGQIKEEQPNGLRDLANVWRGLGLLQANLGVLNQSEQAFRKAVTYIDKAVNQRQALVEEAASIRNDSSAIALRRRNLLEAKRLLCGAIELRSPGQVTFDDAIAASQLNLSSVFREQGEIGSAEYILTELKPKVESFSEARDEIRGDINILIAQLWIYRHDHVRAEEFLRLAETFFAGEYQRTGNHAQRLGRIAQLRQLGSYFDQQWEAVAANGLLARTYFSKASARRFAFDHLDVEFINVVSLSSQNDWVGAENALSNLEKVIAGLELKKPILDKRAEILKRIVQYRGENNDELRKKVGLDIVELTTREKVFGSYDIQTDILVSSVAYPGATDLDAIRAYRASLGARQMNFDKAPRLCDGEIMFKKG